ncbi:MAG: hypothetical protein U7127_01590 [Phormidium sp.]
MNVDEVLDTVEQSLLSRQLSSLERFILCQSWVGRGYSEMAPDCAYSIAHLKDIGSQLWQTLSKAIGQRVTKKNLFLVLKEYLFSQADQQSVEGSVPGVEKQEDGDCDPTLAPSSQLTILPCQNSFTEPVTPHSTTEVPIPPQLTRFGETGTYCLIVNNYDYLSSYYFLPRFACELLFLLGGYFRSQNPLSLICSV